MATQLADGIWWFELPSVNAYLVEDDVLTLVDAGTPLDARTIEAEVEATGHTVADVERVLLTHYDFDHVGGLGRLSGLDATVYIGATDAPVLTNRAHPPWRNPVGPIRGVVSGTWELLKPPWFDHKVPLQYATIPLVRSSGLPIEPLDDGDTVGSFRAYHTPGHSPGHTVYVSEERSVAFFGDLVIERDGELTRSSWLLSSDIGEAKESVRSLAERAPDFDILGMGHGVPFIRDGDERLADLAASLR